MLTSIIIPTFNGLQLLREAVESIRRCTPERYEIIIVDNGSTDGTIEYLRQQNMMFISLPNNTGFPIACNWGLRLARGDYLLLLNNDVLVTDNWLSNLQYAFEHTDSVGIVGPMSNYVSGKQQIAMEGSYVETAAKLQVDARGQYETVNRVVGFCMLFTRVVMRRIGFLDEQFSPGHFEDDDYCYRARLAGYRILMVKDSFVFHHGSASFVQRDPGEVVKLMSRNRQLFMEKWGVDPHEFI